MPNWCSNCCTVEGTEEDLNKLWDFLEPLAENHDEGHLAGKDGDEELVVMFFIQILSDDYFTFESKWVPALGAIRILSQEFNLDIVVEYEESGNCEYGQARYKNGEQVYNVFLEDKDIDLEYDEENDYYFTDKEGRIESDYEYYEAKVRKLVEEKMEELEKTI